jgi:hypothetical protein
MPSETCDRGQTIDDRYLVHAMVPTLAQSLDLLNEAAICSANIFNLDLECRHATCRTRYSGSEARASVERSAIPASDGSL